MKSPHRLPLLLAIAATRLGIPSLAGPLEDDWLKTLSSYNVVWDSQGKNAADSMPVGGGDIGCNVWVENGELFAYFQRSGSFSENGEYLKLGRLRVKLSPNPFANGESFRQELDLHNGCIHLEAGGGEGAPPVKMRFWVETGRPVIHLDIDADKPVEVTASYENWRLQDRELKGKGARFGCFSLEAYPGKVVKLKDQVEFGHGGVLFYHRNPAQCQIPTLLIEQQGLQEHAAHIPDAIANRTFGGLLQGEGFVPAGTSEGKYAITPFRAWSLKSSRPARRQHLQITTHLSQAENLADWKNALLKTAADKNIDTHRKQTIAWWHQFWQRSWIAINPTKPDPSSSVWQAGRNYNLFRYQLGCNATGSHPTKFNGGNLTFDPVLVDKNRPYDPDWRAWGGDVFTAQNQRLLYWPMLKSGDFDAILPQFNFYRRGLPGATIKAKAHFGHAGAVFCEYMNDSGIAFGAGWGWPAPSGRARGKEVPFGDPSINGLAGYGKPAEHGVMANPSVSYHWESQVENAYMMLEYHRFTGADLKPWLPLIEASLVFFDEHYQKRQMIRNGKPLGPDGKLVFYPSTSCESYRGAKNPADLVSGIRACLEALIALDDSILPKEKKEYYRAYLQRMPGLFFEKIKGDKVVKPAESWLKYQNVECPQFYPLFPFNRYQLGEPEIDTFRNTWKHGRFPKNIVKSWHQDGIFYARMGMTREASNYNVQKLKNSPRRYPTFWGPGHDWVPDHNWGGSGMIGLQEMIMQTVGDEIHLLPAWPKDWNASFKLHAPRNTIVSGVVRDGKLVEMKVSPESRRKDVRVFASR
ncbi:MAG: hypothetical protein H7A51_16705 [Akkermansiaceae bacterium]|nr:hypothetical protein [Akkermansiaceae bacterium]